MFQLQLQQDSLERNARCVCRSQQNMDSGSQTLQVLQDVRIESTLMETRGQLTYRWPGIFHRGRVCSQDRYKPDVVSFHQLCARVSDAPCDTGHVSPGASVRDRPHFIGGVALQQTTTGQLVCRKTTWTSIVICTILSPSGRCAIKDPPKTDIGPFDHSVNVWTSYYVTCRSRDLSLHQSGR